MSNFTLNVSESGSFLPVSGFNSPRVFNPGVFEDRRNSYQTSDKQEDIASWRRQNAGKKKWKFTTEEIDAYAQAAVKLTAAVSAFEVPCRLAPLRGAARPCMLVEVMSGGTVRFEYFDFRNRSNGLRHNEIVKDLTAILNQTNPHSELFQIQIIDTAKGGYGITTLIGLLREVHDSIQAFRNQYWSLAVHLLHPPNSKQNIDKIYSARLNCSSKFMVAEIQLYPVPNVVGEDFDEASDFDFERRGDLFIPTPRVVGGDFILESKQGEQLVKTDNVFLTFDEFFSEAITDVLLRDKNRALAEIVWRKIQLTK